MKTLAGPAKAPAKGRGVLWNPLQRFGAYVSLPRAPWPRRYLRRTARPRRQPNGGDWLTALRQAFHFAGFHVLRDMLCLDLGTRTCLRFTLFGLSPNRSNWLPGEGFYGAEPCSSGATVGEGDRSSSTITACGLHWRWQAVRMTEASVCCVAAPRHERLPPHTLRVTTAGRMACSARQLVASMAGLRRKLNSAVHSLVRCAAKR